MGRKAIVALLVLVVVGSGGVLAMEYLGDQSDSDIRVVVEPATEQEVPENAEVLSLNDEALSDLESVQKAVPQAAEQNETVTREITESESEDYSNLYKEVDRVEDQSGYYVRYEGGIFKFYNWAPL